MQVGKACELGIGLTFLKRVAVSRGCIGARNGGHGKPCITNMAIFLQNTNEFPLFWQGSPRRPRPPDLSPLSRVDDEWGCGWADNVEELESRGGRRVGKPWEVGSPRALVWNGGALLTRVVAIGDASWKGRRVGGRVGVPEECRGVARLRRGAKC